MTKIRRDKLQRDIEAGRMEARLYYGYDGRSVHQGSEWRPAKVVPYGQRMQANSDGFVCFDPYDFKYKTGAAWQHDDGIVQLGLPGGESWYLRYKQAA